MGKLRLLLGFLLVGATPIQAQMQYGQYVMVDGDEIYISEVGPDRSGTVYVYARSGSGWEQTGTLQAPPIAAHTAPDDYFGRAIVRDGDQLIVGSTAIDLSGADSSDGVIFLFRRDGDGWAYDSQVRPEAIPSGASFGRFMAFENGRLFVTGLGDNESRGAVWVMERDGAGVWGMTQKLAPPEEAESGHFFGWGLAAHGDRLLVGTTNGSNRAYVFARSDAGPWELEATLEPDEGQNGFGSVVGWLGDRALVGAPFADNGLGAVHVYERNSMTGNWATSLTLTAYDRQSGGQFGQFIHATDGELWIGAPGTDQAGRIYVVEVKGDGFGDVRKLEGLEQDFGDGFGGFIATGERVAAIGQLSDDFNLGSAILMSRSGDRWTADEKVMGPTPPALEALTGGEIACSAGMADRYGCEQVDVLSFLPVAAIGGGRGANTNDVWGWTDPQTGREYALVGRTDGTAFIDVTNAESPVYLGNLAKTPGARGNAWRDIKVYADHAFVVADGAGQHGMQVFDLARLRDVRNAPVEFEPDALYEGIASAHNIVINEGIGYAYAVGSNSGGETCGGGLHMIDIHEPTSPRFVGCFQDTSTGFAGTGYSHDAMCIEYDGPDTEHAGKEVCFGLNENNISIADVSDKDAPVALSHASYPNVAYAHQGWITDDHRYFFMGDEGDEGSAASGQAPAMDGTRTLIWDVSDLDDPVLVKEHFGETQTTDHNLYIRGDLMYQSNYLDGLRVVDISDPENPREVGYLDTVPGRDDVSMQGSWSNYPFFASGTIVVTSGDEGVFFVKYRRPELVP